MVTSIKVNEHTKEKIDRLQAEIFLETGKKLNLQEILDLILGDIDIQKENLIKKLFESSIEISDDIKQKIMNQKKDWGIVTKEEDIDETLYGSDND